jgi:5S rRNA maturation endonuclease (ribonuclease M5)
MLCDGHEAALDNVLARLQGVTRNGEGWAALCPAHEDRNPSLSIHVREGKILFHCHAKCTTEAVCAAAGIELRELFSDNGSAPRIVAEYDYRDERGELLYQVVRREPKDFRQRQPDGSGGWKWNMNGVRRVLYQLAEVLAAKSVLIVEGEKDVETARKLGLVATCNPGGAGKWRDGYGESLRGKRGAIVADADDAGRKHTQAVAASLHSKAASVKVLELPGAKDLSEWVEHGGTREKLLELIRNTPEWKQGAVNGKGAPQGGFQLTSLRDLMLEPEERISYLLADKLPAGGLSVLSAKPKVGKSTFARCLALTVATGEPFLDCSTTKGPVIYLALEEKRGEVRRHFADLGATGEEEIHIHAASAPQEAVLELCQITKKMRPVLIVIDPLFKFVRIRDEKAYAEVCNAIEPLLTLARESVAHVLLSHHSGKMERADATDSILGSTAIFGGVDTAIILKKADRYRTVQSCQRYGTDWPELVLNFDPAERSLSLGVERSEAESGRISEAIAAHLAGCDEPQTRVQIEAHVEGKTKHKRTALKTLCAAGRVAESGAGTKGDPLRYTLNPRSNSQAGNEPKIFVDSCSRVYAGTREQQSENGVEPLTNIGEILVPNVSPEPQNKADSREQVFLEGKL